MGYETLLNKIAGRDVILDESAWFYGLPKFLDDQGINWRRFPPQTPDEFIIQYTKPNEAVITCDKKLAMKLGDRGIRIPTSYKNNTPKENLAKVKRKIRMQRELEIKEMLRDWELSNVTRFNLMRGMRMLFSVDTERGWMPV